ncbi:MAG TPA: LysR family transcriptional regulator [Myxococcaceae bacterium]|nr:LysR family transcriptional regulator [Myxococcaceae bacterium]
MSLLQLETFVAVAEERNVGRAARRLHLTQSPVSRQLSALEEELGTRLFERTSRGMRLLPAGHTLLPRAREILAAVEAARQAVVPGIRTGDPVRAASTLAVSHPRR